MPHQVAATPGSCPGGRSATLIASITVRTRLLAGGNRIRTIGSAKGARRRLRVDSRSRRLLRSRGISRGDMSPSRTLGGVTRYRWFESGSLRRRYGGLPLADVTAADSHRLPSLGTSGQLWSPFTMFPDLSKDHSVCAG